MERPVCDPQRGFDLAFQVFVKTLIGKSIAVDICSSEPIENVKPLIEELTQIPVSWQKLSNNGKQQENGRTVRD